MGMKVSIVGGNAEQSAAFDAVEVGVVSNDEVVNEFLAMMARFALAV
jgi:hypothetical protein